MLSAAQLAYFQSIVAGAFDLTADIKRNQSTTFSIGQPTEDEQTIASGVKCSMMQPSRAVATLYANLIGVQQATVFSFADGQDVQRGDRVVVSGSTWTVQATLTPQSYSVATQVLATKIG